MRKRHSTGGIRKQRGRWIGMWWVDGSVKKSRVLGFVKDMSKSRGAGSGQRRSCAENAKRQADKRLAVWRVR